MEGAIHYMEGAMEELDGAIRCMDGAMVGKGGFGGFWGKVELW
jgi:hypothetical protein